MGEAQATVEFSIELYKFYNVDLFQRGYYQVRTSLKLSPKFSYKIEISLPNYKNDKSIQSSSQLVFPACIVNGTAVSKTFQILYRNEEVNLDDVILFKAHIIVDNKKIEECLQKVDFQVLVELWFTEQTFGPDQHNSIQCVSSRTLRLHLCPFKGLHHHLPVLFDYFHLSAVSITVHGCLVALHQPQLNGAKSSKTSTSWLSTNSSPKGNMRFQPSASLESVLFGTVVMKPSPSLTYLSQARSVHHTICTILLSSYESLQNKLLEYMKLLPPWQQLQIEITDCFAKLVKLKEISKERCKGQQNRVSRPQIYYSNRLDTTRNFDAEDEWFAVVNSDIAQLCAENIILWQQFLEAFTLKDRIQQHLSREHHIQRVKRFAEGFLVIENPRQTIFHCADQSYQEYLGISESIRRNKYFATLPSLGVECLDMDGSPDTLPIIFEDHYQDLAIVGKLNIDKISKGQISTSEINLSVENDEVCKLGKNSLASGDFHRKSDPTPQREKVKKEKSVGCFAGINSKSSISTEEVHQNNHQLNNNNVTNINSSNKNIAANNSNQNRNNRALGKGSTSMDSYMLVRQNAICGGFSYSSSSSDKRPRGPPKSSISVDELARIKEDFKMKVLESKLFKIVPDMPSDNGNCCRPGNIGGRSSVVSIRNTRSLSAVEGLTAGLLTAATRFQSTRSAGGGGIPRLETVPIISPNRLFQLDTAKFNEDLRLHKNKIKSLVPVVSVENECCVNKGEPTENRGVINANGNGIYIKSEGKVKQLEAEAKHRDEVSNAQKNVNLIANTKEKAVKNFDINKTGESCVSKNQLTLNFEVKPSNRRKAAEDSVGFLHNARNCNNNNVPSSSHLNFDSPSLSTSSESVVLTGYRKLEQSESLPLALSYWASKKKRKKKFKAVTDIEDNNGKSGDPSAVSMPNVAIAQTGQSNPTVKTHPLIQIQNCCPGSESMPDLLTDNSTEHIGPSENLQEQDSNQWKSCDSFVVVVSPKAILETDQLVVIDTDKTPIGENDMANNNGHGDGIGLWLKCQNQVNNQPPPRNNRRRSSSSSSGSTSERSGWVSSSDSSDGTSSSPSTSSERGEGGRKPSTSDLGSYVTGKSGDECQMSSNEEERHIYEEIHLPPEEFRDPSPKNNSKTRVPTKIEKAAIPIQNSTAESKKNGRQQEWTGKSGGHRKGDHHRVASSSSSRETGYSTERPNSNEEMVVSSKNHRSKIKTQLPQQQQQQVQANSFPRMRHNSHLIAAKHHQQVQSHPKPLNVKSNPSKMKKKESAIERSNAYLESKCTILEMFTTDSNYSEDNRDDESDNRSKWYAGLSGEEEEDEDREVDFVPAPPPPANRKRVPNNLNQTENPVSSSLVSIVGCDTVKFVKAKEEFKHQLNIQAFLYSDCPVLASNIPYFHVSEDFRLASNEGLHLVICVHGLDGNSADLRLVKTYLELGLPCSNLEFLMSERNQGDTFSDFEKMTDKLVAEILYHIEVYRISPIRISFIGHSLGNIIIRSALARPQMKPLLSRLHTFLSLSGPHLGTLYNTSGLVNMGLWFMQKWKKSGSLLQLSMKDSTDIRKTFLYKLSQKPGLEYFKNVLLFGSSQDRYVPIHSARIELCKAAFKDTSSQGGAYRDMVHGLLQPIARNSSINLVRYDVHHALPNTANSLIGRAAHIAVLDSELFIEKFLTVVGLKYFK